MRLKQTGHLENDAYQSCSGVCKFGTYIQISTTYQKIMRVIEKRGTNCKSNIRFSILIIGGLCNYYAILNLGSNYDLPFSGSKLQSVCFAAMSLLLIS